MEQIILSVCIVTYNHEKYIEQCLESILNQYLPFSYEVIVADDCSTDRTVDVLRKKYGKRINLIERKENVGLSQNLLDLCLQSKGIYIFKLSGDDYLEKEDALYKMVSYLQHNKDCGSVTGWNSVYNEQEARYYRVFSDEGPEEYGLFDLLKGRIPSWYSGVTKNPYLGKNEDEFKYVLNGARNNDEIQNWIMQLEKGKMHIIKEYLMVYRYVNSRQATNYNSNHREIDIFKDVYKNIKVCEKALSSKYNFLPLKMSWINHYCLKICMDVKSMLSFLKLLTIMDAILFSRYKLYLKMHNYENPPKWSSEDFLFIKY